MAHTINARLFARGYGARASGASTPATGRTSTQSPETNCAPPCADCGRLECLCRPRFFAGQLLSEQDLNRLDAYIRAKNKLHTLQLTGWGVVNGLEVRCEPCGTGVVVSTGYAISPCGDDIILCGDAPVDVCALIQKCLPPDNACKPYQGAAAGDCDGVIEDWVLAIRYTETPARGVTALRLGASCSCGASGGSCSSCRATSKPCGCGGKGASSGSCGCGAKPASTTMPTNTATARPRGASPECEPTVTCEGYAWDVFPAPKPPVEGTPLAGPLIDRIACCWQTLVAAFPKPPGQPTPGDFEQQPQKWNLWCCQTKAALLAYFSTGPESNCTLVAKLMAWPCPDPAIEGFSQRMLLAWNTLMLLLLEAVLACLCAALLPPAPSGTSDDRVPLAVVRVRKKDCTVVEVCNWTPLRKMVLTFPTLEYWFGWIPFFASLQDAIHRLCCTALSQLAVGNLGEAARATVGVGGAGTSFSGFVRPDEAATLRANPTLSPEAAANNRTFATLLADAFKRGNTPLDPRAIVGGLLGFDAASAQPLSATEQSNAPHFLLLNEVLRPVVASVLSGQVPADMLRTVLAGATGPAGAAGGAATGAATGGPQEDIAAMKLRMNAMEEALKKLQTTRGKG